MPKTTYTNFGEPRIKVRENFGIDVTPKCNFGCDFCYVSGRPRGKEMALAEFKKIVLDISAFGKEKGFRPSICVAGGRTFFA